MATEEAHPGGTLEAPRRHTEAPRPSGGILKQHLLQPLMFYTKMARATVLRRWERRDPHRSRSLRTEMRGHRTGPELAGAPGVKAPYTTPLEHL